MELTLAQVVEVTGATVVPAGIPGETRISGWSIDSRTTKPGDLFFAIRGEVHDGRSFVEAALAAGAVAAVVEPPYTLVVLQQLARFARQQWGGEMIAVTGSAGKTTTKDMIAAFLGLRGCVGKTIGNFNNHIGLPLSILRLPDEARIAVLEMGMNHAGEIRALARIAEPQIGVITNVGYAHVEAFASIDGVAAAKRELIEELPAAGLAILNADDERVLAFRDCHRGRTITYGFSPAADVRAVEWESGPGGSEFTVHGVRFRTELAGRHNALNILAGLATARAFGIGYEELAPAVAHLRPGPMRGERFARNGITVLNDSYNSNPEAARGMIDVLREEPARRRIAVLGEMLELGRMAEGLHRDLGNYVAHADVDVLVGVCGVSRLMVEQAIQAGMTDHTAFFFEDADSAGVFLRGFVQPGDAVLFKASRAVHLERAIAGMESGF